MNDRHPEMQSQVWRLKKKWFKVKFISYDKGGWRYWNSKLEILVAPLASVSVFWETHLLLGFKIYKFLELS